MQLNMNSAVNSRRGEKAGWIFGIAGAISWVPLMSVIFLFTGKITAGVTGILLFAASFYIIIKKTPWKNPDTPYIKLFVPVILILFTSVLWLLLSFDAFSSDNFPFSVFIFILPVFIPFFTTGKKKWSDN